MKFFLDSAELQEIREAWDMGVICGVTTNPTLIARAGADLRTRLKEILSIVTEGPVNGEAMGESCRELVESARQLSAIDQRIVVKVPMTIEGLKAIKVLKEQGIRTNATLVFTASQCLLAARAGADYISPFLGRLDDAYRTSEGLLKECREIWQVHQLSAELIAASVRSPKHAVMAARYGCHIATVPYRILLEMVKDPLTNVGIKRFNDDWAAAQKAQKSKGEMK
ncbi:MAG: fructose-6-phosphate aldolase [Peptococcaceae bacterium]|nr:fructose-6-phosphate aldolase [Peptococcaceae bacterium]